MAIYIPPGRNRPPDSAVIWTILLALLAPVLAGSAMQSGRVGGVSIRPAPQRVENAGHRRPAEAVISSIK
jgi:hypothetical protein